jgi:hypothetical protein
MATELLCTDVERCAGPKRVVEEEQRNRLAFERISVGRFLKGAGVVDQRLEFGA